MLITPGAIVRARARRHVVVDVDEHEACRSVRLAPVDGTGQPLTLLHPFDRIDVLPAVNTPKRAGRRRVARACAAAVRASYDAGTTRTLVDARIGLLPYQIEPALAILHGKATRILLADEVGLGKTIQAGLVLSELRARQMLRRALILTPAGLREQWAAELRGRFDLEVNSMDAGALAALQRALPPWVNPWTLPGVALASIDLLKRDELFPQLEHVVWDAVVVDEAHHATRGTHRQHVAALACSRARVVVLITATPHNGDRSAFEELCALGSSPGASGLPLRVFRRSRADTQAAAGARRTRIVKVHRTAPEQRLDTKLRAYTERVWREAGMDARLAMVVLRKRALSGPASLARSLTRRIDGLGQAEAPKDSEAQLPLDFTDSVGGELIEDDREPDRELSAPGLSDAGTERQLLAALLDAARAAQREDSKADRLVSAVVSAREPAIVFTEFRDTLADLYRRLEGCATVTLLHGAMMPGERQRSMAAFEGGKARVLLATDAAAEGLNLQRACRWIIHYEVPWSPVRIEQRNGRVDRIGQTKRVHAWHLVAQGTEEEKVLARVATRSSIAARDLGDQQSVAAAVFGDTVPALSSSTPTRRLASSEAVAEAERVELLRRLAWPLAPATRPLHAPTRRGSGQVIGVVCAAVLDSHAKQIASDCVAVRARSVPDCARTAARALGRRAQRTIAVQNAFARAIQDREQVIAAALVRTPAAPLQPSLFDRRLVIDAEHRRQALDRALGELDDHGAATGPCTVRISLVGVLPG